MPIDSLTVDYGAHDFYRCRKHHKSSEVSKTQMKIMKEKMGQKTAHLELIFRIWDELHGAVFC